MITPNGAHAASLRRARAPSIQPTPAAPTARAVVAPGPPPALVPPVGRAARRRPPLRVVAVVALLAGLAALAALAARGDRPPSPARDQPVAVGDASVAVPPDWRPAGRPSSVVPGLAEPAAVLEPFPGIRVHAIVVRSPHGVPRALRDLTGPLGAGRPARLAGVPALAYAERPVAGDRIAELTVARSPSGVLIVACIARSDSWPLAAGCAEEVGPGRTGP